MSENAKKNHSGPSWTCPFCGKPGQRTKEHVWAQWLRLHSIAYVLWSEHYRGERKAMQWPKPVTRPDGTFDLEPTDGPPVSEFLATVTTPVCKSCNSGWMSQLEHRARDLLTPVFHDETTVLDQQAKSTLAAWAVKTFLAYSLATAGTELGGFSMSERKSVAKRERVPTSKWHVWMGFSPDSPDAHMGLGIERGGINEPGAPVPEKMPVNVANCWMAANGIVVLGHWWPEHAGDEAYNMMFPEEERGGLLQIWPASNLRHTWPDARIEPAQWQRQRQFLAWAMEHISMPDVGLTVAERQQAFDEFMAGASPEEVRQKWDRSREA